MKNIPFATNYYINEYGEVFSIKKGSLKRLKSSVDTSQYHRLGLRTDGGKVKKYLVHRLVAICYLDNPDNLAEVNHKDGNKLNNHVTNLEWVSREGNQKHAFATGLNTNLGSKNGKAILDETQVIEIYRSLLEGQLEKDISLRFGVPKNIIRKIKYKATWGHLLKGYPDIPVKYKGESISDSTARWICTQLQTGFKAKDIVVTSTNDRVTLTTVWDIKRRRTFRHISKDFSW